MKAYDKLYLTHSKAVQSVESSLRMIAMMVNFQYKVALPTSELEYAAIELVRTFHDYRMFHFFTRRKQYFQGRPAFTASPTAYLTLQAVQNVQYAAELWAVHRFRAKRWPVIIALEWLKAALRLYLLYCNRGNMICMESFPDRQSLIQSHGKIEAAEVDLVLSARPPFRDRKIRPYSSDRVPFVRTVAELIRIVRPLLYIYLLIKCKKRAWKPFLLSLLLDLTSILLLAKTKLNAEQSRTLTERVTSLAWYLMRYPLLEKVGLDRPPIFQGVSMVDALWGYIMLYRKYYYYVNR